MYMAVPLLLAGLAFGSMGRWRLVMVCMVCCLAIREDLALTVAAWGVYVFFIPKRRILGMIVFVIAIAYLAVAVTLIVPYYRGEAYPHIGSHYIQSVGQTFSVSSLLTSLSFLLTLMLPLAGLPFRSWRLACVALPSLAETMFTTNAELHNLCFQYYVPAMVVLFFAAIETWREIAMRSGAIGCGTSDSGFGRNMPHTCIPGHMPRLRQLRMRWCLLCSALVGQVYLGVGPLSNNPVRPSSPAVLRSDIDSIQRVRSLLPEGSSVTASYRIAAHFLDAGNLWTARNKRLGDMILIHDLDYYDAAKPREVLVQALQTGQYQPAFANYHLVALIRDPVATPLARELMPECLPESVSAVSFDMGMGIKLVGMGLHPIVDSSPNQARKYRVTLIWRCQQRVETDYRFGLTLGEDHSRWGPFYFARGAYPTTVWEPNRLYRDDVVILLRKGESTNFQELRPILLAHRGAERAGHAD